MVQIHGYHKKDGTFVKPHTRKEPVYSPNLTGKEKKQMVAWLKKQIKEEKESAIMYDRKGFDLIAKDERKHVNWLKNALGRLK